MKNSVRKCNPDWVCADNCTTPAQRPTPTVCPRGQKRGPNERQKDDPRELEACVSGGCSLSSDHLNRRLRWLRRSTKESFPHHSLNTSFSEKEARFPRASVRPLARTASENRQNSTSERLQHFRPPCILTVTLWPSTALLIETAS